MGAASNFGIAAGAATFVVISYQLTRVWMVNLDKRGARKQVQSFRLDIDELSQVLASWHSALRASTSGIPDGAGNIYLLEYIRSSDEAVSELHGFRSRMYQALKPILDTKDWKPSISEMEQLRSLVNRKTNEMRARMASTGECRFRGNCPQIIGTISDSPHGLRRCWLSMHNLQLAEHHVLADLAQSSSCHAGQQSVADPSSSHQSETPQLEAVPRQPTSSFSEAASTEKSHVVLPEPSRNSSQQPASSTDSTQGPQAKDKDTEHPSMTENGLRTEASISSKPESAGIEPASGVQSKQAAPRLQPQDLLMPQSMDRPLSAWPTLKPLETMPNFNQTSKDERSHLPSRDLLPPQPMDKPVPDGSLPIPLEAELSFNEPPRRAVPYQGSRGFLGAQHQDNKSLLSLQQLSDLDTWAPIIDWQGPSQGMSSSKHRLQSIGDPNSPEEGYTEGSWVSLKYDVGIKGLRPGVAYYLNAVRLIKQGKKRLKTESEYMLMTGPSPSGKKLGWLAESKLKLADEVEGRPPTRGYDSSSGRRTYEESSPLNEYYNTAPRSEYPTPGERSLFEEQYTPSLYNERRLRSPSSLDDWYNTPSRGGFVTPSKGLLYGEQNNASLYEEEFEEPHPHGWYQST